MFFDQYPRFLQSSDTASGRWRLNLRYEAMIADNTDVLSGARVIDLAAHDGRWSFAALKVGAAHVTGIEAREHLVDNARKSFSAEGVPQDAYEFHSGDMFPILRSNCMTADVVLCLGFVYHTLRYNELLHGIRQTGARHVIVDTNVLKSAGPHLLVRQEGTRADSMAADDEFALRGRTLSGVPTPAALEVMFGTYGYDLEKQFDWPALVARHPGSGQVHQYLRGERITARFRRAG